MPSSTSSRGKKSSASGTRKKPTAGSSRPKNHVVRAVPAHMFVLDTDLVVTNVSDFTLKALGHSRDEVVGKMPCGELCKTPVCGTE